MNLQRLLVERMEHRILVGIVAFLAIMVVTGWVAINEGGRMAAFDRQYTARSIERGAALFVANCSECHGVNGLGQTGRAPALNNPALFGHDFTAELNTEVLVLNAELANENTTEERAAEINARLAEIDVEREAILAQLEPAIAVGYNPETPSRLEQVGWGGSLSSFIYTTLVHGRPASYAYYGAQMAAWGQVAGGPLRTDQLQDLTAYVLNWDKGADWTVEDLLAVQQFAKTPADPVIVEQLEDLLAEGGGEVPNFVGTETPTEEIVAELANYEGDPQSGQALYNGALACAGCHLNAAVAPVTEGTWTRAQEERLPLPEFEGYTPVGYLAESIIHPNAYVVPGYPEGVMPQNFGERLTYQDLADLIAYLASQDQPVS